MTKLRIRGVLRLITGGSDTADIARGARRLSKLHPDPDRAVDAASLWLALKLLGLREWVPTPRRMERLTGVSAAALVQAERDVCQQAGWKLWSVVHPTPRRRSRKAPPPTPPPPLTPTLLLS
jgi:hypothetical protein